jgi:hypothetical protein
MQIPPAPVEVIPKIMAAGKEDEYRAARWHNDVALARNPFPVETLPNSFQIPCPNGHALETPPEMLGKFAMCPHCQAKFKLEREHSWEYLAQQRQRQAERDAQLSRISFHCAIVATVLTLLGVALLFLLVV